MQVCKRFVYAAIARLALGQISKYFFFVYKFTSAKKISFRKRIKKFIFADLFPIVIF